MDYKTIWLYPIFLCISTISAQSIDSWELVDDEDGIEIYKRASTHSKFHEVKIEAELDVEIGEFMSFLNDPTHYEQWVYQCSESNILEKKTEHNYIYYTVSDLPFPMSDRDMVVECTQWSDDDGTIHSHSTGVPDLIPLSKDKVRVPKFNSEWVVSPTGKNRIWIQYTALVEPGGYLPAWLVNLAITAGPYRSFKKLMSKFS